MAEASPRIDDVDSSVIRLVVDAGGAVVNAGGIVRRGRRADTAGEERGS